VRTTSSSVPGARRRLARALALAIVVSAAAPAPALAHGLPSPPGVPVPGFLFAWGAAIVLIASFAALSALWKEPRLEGARPRRLVRLPRALDPACGALGVAAFAGLVYCGLAGAQAQTANLLPTFVYVLFWVGLVVLSVLFGDLFAAFNPWRAAARAVAWLAARAGARIPPPLPYPARLGRWPAVAGIAAFAWLELAYTNRGAPATLALLALAYAALQLVGMALYGIEPWSSRGDGFGVYFNLFSRMSPLARSGQWLARRPALSGLAALQPAAGTVALLCVMIGSTSFDGLSATTPWRQLAPKLQRDFERLGTGPGAGAELASTVGLLVMIALIAGVYALGVRGMRSLIPDRSASDLARLFVHALVPIAAGYVLAHYFTFLVYQGQAVGALISDPLGHGADLFGTAHATIDYQAIPKSAVWYVQVAALVCGHVAGLVLAHDRAVAIFRDGDVATRSQYWMLTVMVGYTGLGLWLLASIAR
jgi:hypothetical protein